MLFGYFTLCDFFLLEIGKGFTVVGIAERKGQEADGRSDVPDKRSRAPI